MIVRFIHIFAELCDNCLDDIIRIGDMTTADGSMKIIGTDIDKIFPPVSRFVNGGRDTINLSALENILAFFKIYLRLFYCMKRKEYVFKWTSA